MLLIANMVQVAAYTRRTEIGIMRLVGASRWYTQLPFLVEAMLSGFIGVVIAIIGLIVVRALFLENVILAGGVTVLAVGASRGDREDRDVERKYASEPDPSGDLPLALGLGLLA